MPSFYIVGKPQPKQRPRFSRGHAYTPTETRNYERVVRCAYKEQCHNTRLNGAIKADIIVSVKIPKSTPKKQLPLYENGTIRPTKKPDADNIIKSVLDALNETAYEDDSQVIDVHCVKQYGYEDGVYVELLEI